MSGGAGNFALPNFAPPAPIAACLIVR